MFKNPNQRKFLFALDKDRQQDHSPIPPSNPMMNKQPANPLNKQSTVQPLMKQQVPKLDMPAQPMNPTAVPSLPQINKLPKFGRVKKFFKS